MMRVAVLGAGVNGLASAVRIQEAFPTAIVVLISKEFSPNTTGDGSAGFWFPFLCGDTPQENIYEWGKETYEFLLNLWREGSSHVCLLPAFVFNDDEISKNPPKWSEFVFGFNVMNVKTLRHMEDLHSSKYRSGIYFTTLTAPPTSILPYLLSRFVSAGGHVIKREVQCLDDTTLGRFNVVINCCGLGARRLVSDDKVFPIRGQVMRVRAPWVYQVIVDATAGNYIIPNAECVVLGGTHQENDYNTTIDKRDTEFITKGCQNILPSLQKAEVLSEWAGLRPGRERVRLEGEVAGNRLVVHNYGHGGSGVTLFWGCAGKVVRLVEQYVGLAGRVPSKM